MNVISATLRPNDETCPDCGKRNLRRLKVFDSATAGAASTYDIVECPACQFAWQWPLRRSELEGFEWFRGQYERGSKNSYFDPKSRRAISDLQLDFLETRTSVPGTLLDVGAGDGAFVRMAAARGWKSIGVEPAATESLTFEGNWNGAAMLVAGTLRALDPANTFDVVTLWDVIEHLEDPVEVLGDAARRLKPGGILVVETGNYLSAGRIMAGSTWWCYQLDHRWYFSASVLQRLLTRIGFREFCYADRVFRPWWRGGATYEPPSLLALTRGLVRHPFAATKRLRMHRNLKEVAKQPFAGLEIITVAARA